MSLSNLMWKSEFTLWIYRKQNVTPSFHRMFVFSSQSIFHIPQCLYKFGFLKWPMILLFVKFGHIIYMIHITWLVSNLLREAYLGYIYLMITSICSFYWYYYTTSTATITFTTTITATTTSTAALLRLLILLYPFF